MLGNAWPPTWQRWRKWARCSHPNTSEQALRVRCIPGFCGRRVQCGAPCRTGEELVLRACRGRWLGTPVCLCASPASVLLLSPSCVPTRRPRPPASPPARRRTHCCQPLFPITPHCLAHHCSLPPSAAPPTRTLDSHTRWCPTSPAASGRCALGGGEHGGGSGGGRGRHAVPAAGRLHVRMCACRLAILTSILTH